MRYLLDTNICVTLIRRRDTRLTERLMAQRIESIGVSAVTVAELQYGVAKSSRPQENQEALDLFLLPLAILPLDEESSVAYGEIRAHLERQGTPIGPMDLLIAAQALSHDLVLVTNNVGEFSRVPGLRIEDWTQL